MAHRPPPPVRRRNQLGFVRTGGQAKPTHNQPPPQAPRIFFSEALLPRQTAGPSRKQADVEEEVGDDRDDDVDVVEEDPEVVVSTQDTDTVRHGLLTTKGIRNAPLKVEAERKKRLFASQDIENLLRNQGVDHSAGIIHGRDISQPSYLPLDMFDNLDYESRTPAEWLSTGMDESGEFVPIPAKALDQTTFRDCFVYDYIEEESKYIVEWENSGERKVVSRIDLFFVGEDPFLFARRVAWAYETKFKAESAMRYNLYVDSMPTDEIPPLDQEHMDRILAKGVKSPRFTGTDPQIHALVQEINFDFFRTQNKMIFDQRLADSTYRDMFDGVCLPPAPSFSKTSREPINIPPFSFPERRQEFLFHTFITKPQIVNALFAMRKHCNELAERSLFATMFKTVLRLPDFEQAQTQCCAQLIHYIKHDWTTFMKSAIRDNLKDIGKGWFNLQEKNMEVYQFSKLKRLMRVVNLMMEDTLRTLTQRSMQAYACLIGCGLMAKVIVHDPKVVCVEPASAGIQDSNPLFRIDLVVREGTLQYSTPVTQFVLVPLAIFDKTVESLSGIPQLEPQIMEHIFWSRISTVEVLTAKDEEVVTIRQKIEQVLTSSVEPLCRYIECFGAHATILDVNSTSYIASFEERTPSIAEFRDEIQRHLKNRESVDTQLPASIRVGIFEVDVREAKSILLEKHNELANGLMAVLCRQTREKATEIATAFLDLDAQLHVHPTTIESLVDLKRFLLTIPGTSHTLAKKIENLKQSYALLEECLYTVSQEDFDLEWSLYGWPKRIEEAAMEVADQLDQEKDILHRDMHREQESFANIVQDLADKVTSFARYSNLDEAGDVALEVEGVQSQLDEAKEKARLFNSREELFGSKPTQYSALQKTVKEFEPYGLFWITARDWQRWHKEWLEGPFVDLQTDTMEENFSNALRGIMKSSKLFKEMGTAELVEMATSIRQQLEHFKVHLPLVLELRNPGMRQRHWDQLSQDLGFDFRPDETTTLHGLLELGLGERLEQISRVSEVADREYRIETSLDGMEKKWQDVVLELVSFRETGTMILRGTDDIFQLLDDHLVMTQAMAFSAFKKVFENRIMQWENKLRLMADTLEEWLMFQKQWLYLEPIFSSEGISRQLPTEAKRFAGVDRLWRSIMKRAHAAPLMIQFCNMKLLDSLRESNRSLDIIQKGLSDYLETKRSSFARFYFLSNDELLDILSRSKDVQAVQPHLRKCFENIARLDFEDDLQITAMMSTEGERVPFVETMRAAGNVEDWMRDVEKMMKRSVKKVLMDGVVDYGKQHRADWVLRWPAQVVLTVSQIMWTQDVTDAINAGGIAMKELYKKQVSHLRDLVKLVRGPLSKLERLTLGGLIVLDVHARDVVDRLVELAISSDNDFEWISQLRYYVEDDECLVQSVQSCYQYGYEYLGNTTRLVITPLTDRCYMTLMTALSLTLGGAPAGPAGTGKTETTKDLAKALAKQCVVFNCSEGLDYLAMGKFFKGLACSGAWACFDEFNRIDIEVLSVIAQQIMTIQKALQEKATRFNFEGQDIPLDAQCAVFITMNPGYAGRTELPDNLKALFRPVAMMVPDYALIAEISLFSFGFNQAKTLSRKIVATFKLSSEQLSSQDHYDFGMRAVKTVISAAGNLKRDYPDLDEEVLVLRALCDVNIPKFLKDDRQLFEGIISDLFPGTQQSDTDYEALLEALKQSSTEQGLQPADAFLAKCIQLHETTLVRHGLMLVGPSGGGKTCCWRSLASALGKLKKAGTGTHEAVQTYVLNPKSITMGQLYGQFDENTHEWTDGVVASIIRRCVSDPSSDKKWVVFDGPVDALWIENMNTVLDDNKKLCLTSGEIITLTADMTMIFEVENLAVASPATVSRCGMVYVDPGVLGWEPLVKSWITRLPSSIQVHAEHLYSLFASFVPLTMEFVRRNLREPVPTVDNGLINSLLHLLECFFSPFFEREDEGRNRFSNKDLEDLANNLDPLFFFSVVWSLGATTDKEGRVKFDAYLRQIMNEDSSTTCVFPEGGLVYDYMFDQGKGAWIGWLETIPEFVLDPTTPFSDILIPTLDSVRLTFLLDLLVKNGKNVLCTGPTGTGKTSVIANKLLNEMPDLFQPIVLNFSARTSANVIQDLLDSRLDRRRKGVFGPPVGKKYVIFVDDLNMPTREKYMAQPPIELLRQWMDHKGWYDRKKIEFREVVDVQFVGAMGPPGGGRNPVTPRFLRHFNLIALTELGDESLFRIFNTILATHMQANFASDLHKLCGPLIHATITVYNTITNELLPIPSKPHYTFNLRDLAKVIQGILSAEPKRIPKKEDLVRLWLHECTRVFSDRLVDDHDCQWFCDLLRTHMTTAFQVSYTDVCSEDRRLLYGDFLIPNADPKIYSELPDVKTVMRVVSEYLDDYNATSNKPMHLVLFTDAVDHVTRISRIIRQARGNALLLGVGGSGRQSLTKLAAFMAEFDLVQIEVSKGYGMVEWREDVKKILLRAGVHGTPVIFLLSDTQIIYEAFLEDINSIMNSGEVPNLMGSDDLENIVSSLRSVCQQSGIPLNKLSIYNFFLGRVRANLRIVLCMSPIGEAIRNRLRMFPSLVNCSTIDWFAEWPAEALRSVASDAIQAVELATEDIHQGVVEMCVMIHQSVAQKSQQYLLELQRHNYVTPTSYLELLSTFESLLAEKRQENDQLRRRLQTGLTRLLDTEEEVQRMQGELQELHPVLTKTQQEVDDMMVQIEEDKRDAEETKATVEKEEKEAEEKRAETQLIADDAQRDLDEALPALDAAVASLKALNRNDIVEIRSMQRPPRGVKLVMEAVCILMGVKPNKVNHPDKIGQKIDDYWEPGKSLLSDPTEFLKSLLAFDKENIPDAVIAKVQPYIQMDEFLPQNAQKVSIACTSLCLWVRAMEKYHTVLRLVEPKKQRLAEAQQSLERTIAALDSAKERLSAVQARIAELEVNYASTVIRKEELARKVAEVTVQLERAQKLIRGLGAEKGRWKAKVENLSEAYENLVGDSLLSAGCIAYLGAFTASYRSLLVESWREAEAKFGVPRSEGVGLLSLIGDPVQLRQWNVAGLPTDPLSTENGIMMSKARRWPLMIDPQGQANRWIKNMEKERALDIIKPSDRDCIRTLENGVRFGKPVLLENVGEDLDAALEPLLLKQTFMQGNTEMIKLGDSVIPYNKDFRLYITTKLSNPHYKPDVAVKVTLLNFTITLEGLQDQLLALVVAKERPDLEEGKNQLVVSNAAMRKELKEIEDKILYLLYNSQGNILDDEVLINTLAASKEKSEEIQRKVAEAEKTEEEIDAMRSLYKPVAKRAALLYFCIVDLAIVDPMYQYSLSWFIGLFSQAIAKAPTSPELGSRLKHLNDTFTFLLYESVCRSLFEKHKILFSFLLCMKILDGDGCIDPAEWRFLVAGPAGDNTVQDEPNPAPNWLPDKAWKEMQALSNLPHFQGLKADFAERQTDFHKITESVGSPLPAPWNSTLSSFQHLLVLRCLCPDRMVATVREFVAANLGPQYVEPPPFDLAASYRASGPCTPLIFVLSTGADPASELYRFAEGMGMRQRLQSISLGQGQGPKAELMIREAVEDGSWVLLQNCHLAASWMPTLEKLVEGFSPDIVRPDFRLWLTSMPSALFPVSILQNSVKMTHEPPKGLRANLSRTYAGFDDGFLQSSTRPVEWQKLLFGLSFFHAITQERRKFGPLGWNIPYEFTTGDLNVCIQQLGIFLEEYEAIPYRVIRFLCGHINYGGRVTDDWDRRTLITILDNFISPDVLVDGHPFSPSRAYVSPAARDHKGYVEHIKTLPAVPQPEIFGLHSNADITHDLNETQALFETILSLQPRTGAASGLSREKVIADTVEWILRRLPKSFDVDAITARYPLVYKESMNTVLLQEALRYNALLSVLATSLREMTKALKGLVVMSEDLEKMGNSLLNNAVPDMWKAKAYPSLKPLSSWVIDLGARCQFIQDWVDKGIPNVFWISGFFFPQAFLTGTLQNYARKDAIPIDTISFSFHVLDESEVDTTKKPKEGCYIRGLFLQGARWDSERKSVVESRPKELYTKMPVIHLLPVANRKKPYSGIYECPVYKTLTRAGTLSTTGHSTNYVLTIELPSQKPQDVWIKAGVALVCSLND